MNSYKIKQELNKLINTVIKYEKKEYLISNVKIVNATVVILTDSHSVIFSINNYADFKNAMVVIKKAPKQVEEIAIDEVVRRSNSNKHVGSTLCKKSGKWISAITRNRKRKHLGSFDTDLEAHEAYKAAAAINPSKVVKTSKYIGVCLYKQTGKWHAQISVNGRTRNIGHFTDEIDAHEAYQEALSKARGKMYTEKQRSECITLFNRTELYAGEEVIDNSDATIAKEVGLSKELTGRIISAYLKDKRNKINETINQNLSHHE